MPSWPERAAWVPPQSSRAYSPTSTTRTWSPYFSPNSAIAPIRRASSCVVTNARTSRSASAISLICCSTSASTLTGTADGEAKSNRKRPGALSEPAWVADSPSASRSALCTRWVAVWARETDAAPLDVDLGEHGCPVRASPRTTRAVCTVRSGSAFCTSVTSSSVPSASTRRPASASWPPASA